MAKRKKCKKRVAGRPIAPVQASRPSERSTGNPGVTGQTVLAAPAPEAPQSAVKAVDPRWAYVRRDVTRVGILAGVCVLIELALWYLFNHTGLGDAVYRLIKI